MFLPSFTLKNLKTNYQTKESYFDISNWDFEKNGNIELKGEWEFYWEKFILTDKIKNINPDKIVIFPSIWTKYEIDNKKLDSYGFASYKLNLKTNKNYNNLSLQIPDFYTSYRLWLNGKIISENGVIAKDKVNNIPFWLPKNQRIELLKGNNELVIEIANFNHIKGGGNKPIVLGLDEYITREREFEITKVFTLTGILLMGGVLCFGLYLFGKREKYILYFFLFCLTYSYRIFGTYFYLIHNLLQKNYFFINLSLEYLTLYLSSTFFILFTKELYPKQTSDYFVKFNIIINTILCISVLFPPYIYTQEVELFFVLMILNIIYTFIIFTKATLDKEKGAFFSLIGSISFLSVGIFNILNYFMVLSYYSLLYFIGTISFFLFQSLVLAYRFADSFKMAEKEAHAGLKIKSDFIATMSHEIRTPMNGIIGMTELMLNTNINNEQKDFLETIKISGNNLMQIINEILDFSKMESSKLQIEYKNMDLLNCVEEVISLFSYNAAQKNIELDYYFEPDVPKIIYSDYLRIKQVLSNIISNAIKFTEKGEIILFVKLKNDFKTSYGVSTQQEKEIVGSAETPEHSSEVFSNNNKNELYTLEFIISDTGIGIPEDKKDKIFKPFTQLDSSLSRKYSGTGLGLVISKNIIELLGGTINFDSTLNKGSTFTFTIQSKIEELKPIYEKINNKFNIQVFIQNIKIKEITKLKLNNMGLNLINENEIPDIIISDYENMDYSKKTNVIFIKKQNYVDNTSIVQFNDITKEPTSKYIIYPILNNKLFNSIMSFSTNNNLITENKIKYPNLVTKELNILVAEDNQINQKVIITLIKKLGLKVDIAINGLDVLKKIKEKSYDIIFMDVQMPEMNGIEATIELRKINKEIPIVALTANAMSEDKELCINSGMNDYLSKPVKLEELDNILKKYFSII
ncbi:MAG: response regulator [Candidatus Sericytochromatia bacterium]